MEVTPELLGAVLKDGGVPLVLLYVAYYLWKRVAELTDAYISSIKEQTKVISDNTASNNMVARALDQLTNAVNSSDKGK